MSRGGYLPTGDAVVVAFDLLPDQARVLGIDQATIDLVAEPFDGYVYAIRPAVPIFEVTRTPADDLHSYVVAESGELAP